MIRVAITGGIGSGKTTIAKIFEELGVPVFNSDKCARNAEFVPHIQEQYKRVLGDDIFIDGVMDRPKMRNIVFNDATKLLELNEFMIPYVSNSFKEFCKEHDKSLIVMLESAIIFETGNEKNFDYMISVIADVDTRIERVMKRDNLSHDDVIKKINNQFSDNQRMYKSNFVILNDNIGKLDPKVLDIFFSLNKLALTKKRIDEKL